MLLRNFGIHFKRLEGTPTHATTVLIHIITKPEVLQEVLIFQKILVCGCSTCTFFTKSVKLAENPCFLKYPVLYEK
jgi:hypothetical protein